MCPCLYIIQGQLPFTFVITVERSNYLADAESTVCRSIIRLFALLPNIFLTGGVTVGGGQHKPIYRKHFQKNFFIFINNESHEYVQVARDSIDIASTNRLYTDRKLTK